MANSILTPTKICKESIMHLKNECIMGNLIHRGYQKEFGRDGNGFLPGSSVTIKAPQYFRVKDGATVDTVDLYQRSTTLSLSYRKHIAVALTGEELTYSMSKFAEDIIMPAMRSLGNYIDTQILGLYKHIGNQVGTPNVTPTSASTYTLANAYLTQEGVPLEDRFCVVDPIAYAKMVDANRGILHTGIAGDAVKKGRISREFAGFSEMYQSANVQNHTPGSWAGGTVYVDDTVAEGDANMNLDQDGAGSALTVKQGDIFTIASVNGVNPVSGQSLGRSRQFVVDADGTFADAGGGDYNLTVSCTPGTSPYQIYSASAGETYLPFQNVDALPADDALLTIPGTASTDYTANLAFHKNAMTMAMVPLHKFDSASWVAQESYDGYTIRVLKYLDGANDTEYIRFDILFGLKVLNPFMACRIAG